MNTFLSGNHFPDMSTLVPRGDATLAGLYDDALDEMDQVVALGRALQAAIDRHGGALEIGNQACAATRLLEARAFLDHIRSEAAQWRAIVQEIITRADAIRPTGLSRMLTQQDMLDTRELTVAGELRTTIEGIAFSAWHVTSVEEDDIETRAATITDTDINEFFRGERKMTLRDALVRAVDGIVEGVNAVTISDLLGPTPTPTPTRVRHQRHRPNSPHSPHSPHAPHAPHRRPLG